MEVDLTELRPGDRPTIVALLDDYLHELAGHREIAIGATEASSYPYLDAYFSEAGRHAFLIRHNGKVVGFTLIRGPASTGRVWQVAEFYIAPGSRHIGIGREATASIWGRFPGSWELQVHARNSAAVQFWASCIEASAEEPPVMEEIATADGRRSSSSFVSDTPVEPSSTRRREARHKWTYGRPLSTRSRPGHKESRLTTTSSRTRCARR